MLILKHHAHCLRHGCSLTPCAISVLYLVLSPCSQPLLRIPLKHCLSMYTGPESCTLRLSGIQFPLGCNLFANTLFESTRLKTLYFSHPAYVLISSMSGM